MTFQQKFIRFSQGVFVVAAAVLLIAPASAFPPYYKPTLMAIAALLYSFFIALPELILPISSAATASDRKEKLRIRSRMQVMLALGLLLSGLGSLGLWSLYELGVPYDKFVHFLFSALMMIGGVAVFQVWRGWSLKKALIVLALIIGVSGVVWEFVEFFSDGLLHFGYFGHLFDADSVHDMLANLLGIIVGGSIVWAWYAYHNRRYKQ